MGRMTQNDMVGYIIDYEAGTIEPDDFLELFQYLVDTGQAWQLKGHYGRTAQALIEAGYIRPARKGKA